MLRWCSGLIVSQTQTKHMAEGAYKAPLGLKREEVEL